MRLLGDHFHPMVSEVVDIHLPMSIVHLIVYRHSAHRQHQRTDYATMASDSNIDRAIGQLPPPSSSSSSSPSHMTSLRRQGSSSRDVLPSHHRPGQLHVHGRTRSISISSRASGFSQEELVRPTLTFADDRGELKTPSLDISLVPAGENNMLTTASLPCFYHHITIYVEGRLAHGTPPTLTNRTESIRMEEDHARPPLPGFGHFAVDLPIHRSAPTSPECTLMSSEHT